MSRAAFARIPPADRDRVRAAAAYDRASRKRRVAAVAAAAVLGVASIVGGLATDVVVVGIAAAAGLALLARLYVRIERDRVFQIGFAGSGLTPAERASVLAMLRDDDDGE